MNILENLLSTFKEILYDIIGYVLPGLFILFLIYVPFKLGCFCSFMYAIYEIIFKSKINFFVDFLSITSTFSWITIFIIIFSSYLLGHLAIYLSNMLGFIFKSTKKIHATIKKNISKILKVTIYYENNYTKFCDNIFKRILINIIILSAKIIYLISKSIKSIINYFSPSRDSYDELCDNILKNLESNPKFKKELFMSSYKIKDTKIEIMKYNEKFLTTFASTNSRFISHNDLIQKYICKINFYNSFSCIFFILFIDSIISIFIWKTYNPSVHVVFFKYKVALIVCSLFIFYCALFKQYKKHYDLKKKECYLFLYEYFNKREN